MATEGPGRALFVRSASGEPAHIAPSVQKVMQGASGELPYADLRVLYDLTESERRPWNLGATMFTAFGVLALLLSAVGLYGVMAYGVTQRTHEMGVRRALGAQAGNVVALVVRQGVGAVSAGIAVGLVATIAASRFVEPHLYRISPRDPVVLVLVVLTLMLVAVIASMVPAWRASRVSPMVAMRAE